MSETVRQHAEPDHLHPSQALVIRPDGTAQMVFLGVIHGREIRGRYRGHIWVAHEAHGASDPNPVATAFACSLGWKGRTLHGPVVFTGPASSLDVPGVVVAQIIRFLDEVELG